MEIKAKLIKFILSFTDYDRLKKENEKLRKDISVLIEHPNSVESYIITESYRIDKQISKMVWMGDCGVGLDHFEGIVKHTTI